jgi:DNA-binding CsgD family transcriptional regulator
VGVPVAIWERPGPLTIAEWDQVRLHPYHGERILHRAEAFRAIAPLVGMHHERLDGSGYHRGHRGYAVPPGARLLAAADAFQAMTHTRPHRPAMTGEQAAEQLEAEVRAGRHDGDVVDAVMAEGGVPTSTTTRAPSPAGLTDREVEVLRLVAAGLSNRQIGERLRVSPRTAEHHVQHVYSKIGLSSRAAAALFAMEHDLLLRPTDG